MQTALLPKLTDEPLKSNRLLPNWY